MRVNPDRDFKLLLEAVDDGEGFHRRDEPCHVFQHDGVGTHLLQLHAHLDELGHGVRRTAGVANRAVCLRTGRFTGVDRALHVSRVIERVKDPENIHPVIGARLDEGCDHVVGEVGVLNDILPAQ